MTQQNRMKMTMQKTMKIIMFAAAMMMYMAAQATVACERMTDSLANEPVEGKELGAVAVTARRKMESERALQNERMKATTQIENIGAKEMSVKGLSNVEQGVKKLTGISTADAGQLIVRGLGDRYSLTSLNGLLIASPNPDNKLIPLDLFPASVVQNITVSKVYGADAWADYSGAHIDIRTKDSANEPFLNAALNVGGNIGTLGKGIYNMDGANLWKNNSLDSKLLSMPLADFDKYAASHTVFPTTFDVKKRTALPYFGGTLSAGRNWMIGRQRLDILGSLNIGNSTLLRDGSFYKTLEATGNVQNDFRSDESIRRLNLAAFAYAGLSFRGRDHVGYTFFFARNAEDSYKQREGMDAEGHQLVGSNSTTHIYSLLNHQLRGKHFFGDCWQAEWSGSYGTTGSDEPDRRQMMFEKDDAGALRLFKLNRQETMRYFGTLDEEEWMGRASLQYNLPTDDEFATRRDYIRLGFDYKNKQRDYQATRFYYNLSRVNPIIDDIFTPSDWLDMSAVSIERKMQPKDSYRAENDIAAAYIAGDFSLGNSLILSPGLRFEHSRQAVEYTTDGGERYGRRRTLEQADLFPSLNIKYNMRERQSLRLALSRTVTRPQFIEMAPFLYQESYGAAQIRGNEALTNAYNYNLDLRYEIYSRKGDMISATAYYKHLDRPIERVQGLNGGATVHTFQNADNGMAAGVEIEARKQLLKDLKIGANLSLMYTNVKLPDGGAYTNKERSLQGASPILLNADLVWSPKLSERSSLSLALLYNMQGSRIHAVGVSGLGDVKQAAIHTLNLAASWQISPKLTLKAQASDMFARPVVYRQQVPQTGTTVEVERYKEGTSMEIGIGLKL